MIQGLSLARSRIDFLLSARNTGSHRKIQDKRRSPDIRPILSDVNFTSVAIKKEAADLATSNLHFVIPKSAFRHPSVGIIQIRFSVEGHTFLSACTTSSRFLFICLYYIILKQKFQYFFEKRIIAGH